MTFTVSTYKYVRNGLHLYTCALYSFQHSVPPLLDSNLCAHRSLYSLSRLKHIRVPLIDPTYLMRRSLLHQHIAVRIEQEHTECPVELDPAVRIHAMAIPFRSIAQRLIVHINQNTILLQRRFLQQLRLLCDNGASLQWTTHNTPYESCHTLLATIEKHNSVQPWLV